MIQPTTALRKIAKLRKPVRIVRGGQGSSKTYSILTILINHASSKPDREILVISAELTKMRLTVIKDFVKIMKLCGIFNPNRFIGGTLYRFPNGSFMKFIGLDKEDVGKGLRSNVAYFNEVNKCNRESYIQVASRTDIVYADYNPDAEFFIDEDVIPLPDTDFLQLTFEDNELLPERERQNILNYKINGYHPDGTIKNAYWANRWQVYGLGNIGNLQGCVFENWEECDEIPEGAEFIAHGMDFGHNDPTTDVKVFKYNGDLYIDEYLYKSGLSPSRIMSELLTAGVTRQEKIIGDCAESLTITELQEAGFNIEKSEKGPDSIRASINFLQDYKIYITKRSHNLKKELRAYRWAEDKNGKSLNEPIDSNNHLIDPIRYVALNCLMKDNSWDIF